MFLRPSFLLRFGELLIAAQPGFVLDTNWEAEVDLESAVSLAQKHDVEDRTIGFHVNRLSRVVDFLFPTRDLPRSHTTKVKATVTIITITHKNLSLAFPHYNIIRRVAVLFHPASHIPSRCRWFHTNELRISSMLQTFHP